MRSRGGVAFEVDGGGIFADNHGMTPEEQNFADYKNAEKKALELVGAMKATSPKKADIEVAMLVALFELHRGQTDPATVGKIIQSHLETIVPFYVNQARSTET